MRCGQSCCRVVVLGAIVLGRDRMRREGPGGAGQQRGDAVARTDTAGACDVDRSWQRRTGVYVRAGPDRGRRRGRGDPRRLSSILRGSGARRASLDAAIATAAYRVARTRVNSPRRLAHARQPVHRVHRGHPRRPAKADGIAVGEAAAAPTLAARASDNFYNTAAYTNPPPDPGVWQASRSPTTSRPRAQRLHDGVHDPAHPGSPGAVARRRRSPWTRGSTRRTLHEVQETGGKTSALRTAEMTDAVQFWTEGGFTLWGRNTRDIVIARGLDELESARALAVLGLAGGEAMLACWEAKYHYMSWRPFQAIQRADEDGNTTRSRSRLGTRGSVRTTPSTPRATPATGRRWSPASRRSSAKTSR